MIGLKLSYRRNHTNRWRGFDYRYGYSFLNGPSSSGKSSIAKELQDALQPYYLHIGIDTFISMMPAKSNKLTGVTDSADGFFFEARKHEGHTLYKVSSGSYGTKVNEAYRSTVRHLVNCGLRVIVDDVINGSEEWQEWTKVLSGISCLSVGVFCNDAELVRREKLRPKRKQGSALEQTSRVHTGMEYDIKVNTSELSITQCAQAIARHVTNPTDTHEYRG